MTNGEMIQKVFNCEVCEPIIEDDIIHVIFADKKDSAIGFDWSWWNVEYKEPTTKNDIGVDCISREATGKRLCNLAEYMNEHKENCGDPYIMAALFIQDNKTEFPSVTPQESFINKPCVSEKACEHDKNKVLNKIRAEIQDIAFDWQEIDGEHESFMVVDLNDALNIIDKYKAESEA